MSLPFFDTSSLYMVGSIVVIVLLFILAPRLLKFYSPIGSEMSYNDVRKRVKLLKKKTDKLKAQALFPEDVDFTGSVAGLVNELSEVLESNTQQNPAPQPTTPAQPPQQSQAQAQQQVITENLQETYDPLGLGLKVEKKTLRFNKLLKLKNKLSSLKKKLNEQPKNSTVKTEEIKKEVKNINNKTDEAIKKLDVKVVEVFLSPFNEISNLNYYKDIKEAILYFYNFLGIELNIVNNFSKSNNFYRKIIFSDNNSGTMGFKEENGFKFVFYEINKSYFNKLELNDKKRIIIETIESLELYAKNYNISLGLDKKIQESHISTKYANKLYATKNRALELAINTTDWLNWTGIHNVGNGPIINKNRNVVRDNIKSFLSLDNNNLIKTKNFVDLLNEAKNFLNEDAALMNVLTSNDRGNKKYVIVGDTHGEVDVTLSILQRHWEDFNKGTIYGFIFLGDYVDRGWNSVANLSLLLTLLVHIRSKNPSKEAPRFILLRGNHESKEVYSNYGFSKELEEFAISNYYKLDDLIKVIDEVFASMPLCAILQERHFMVHGGPIVFNQKYLSTNIDKNKFNLDLIKKTAIIADDHIASQLTWNDPNPDEAYANRRGLGYMFGPEQMNEFFDKVNELKGWKKNVNINYQNLKRLFRAHQVSIGNEIRDSFKSSLISVFSAGYGGNGIPFCVLFDGENIQFIALNNESTTTNYLNDYTKAVEEDKLSSIKIGLSPKVPNNPNQ